MSVDVEKPFEEEVRGERGRKVYEYVTTEYGSNGSKEGTGEKFPTLSATTAAPLPPTSRRPL